MGSAARLFLLSLAGFLTAISGQECAADSDACDKHERCPVWREEGECFRSKAYMQEHCPVSCRLDEEERARERTLKDKKDKTTTKDDNDTCIDQHKHCPQWASLGECEANIAVMKEYCPVSCKYCHAPCLNTHDNCQFWAEKGECDNNQAWMHANCPKACNSCPKEQPKQVVDDLQVQTETFGVRQTVDGAQAPDTLQKIKGSVEYMKSEQFVTLPDDIQSSCQNRHELCSFWSAIGECENNRAYMKTNCAPACQSCHLIDMEARCPKLESPEPALEAGDLNKLFERILRNAPGNHTSVEYEEGPRYTVHVHSRPDSTDKIDPALDKSMPPWVITLDGFLTPEECQELIDLGHKYGYKRSEDVGQQKFDGTYGSVQSKRRTSENAWCSSFAGCRDEALPQRIHRRMAAVMNIPAANSEDLQLLKYEEGQFYRTHHDYIPSQKERQCGPRILTFFLYLSDVEQGGGTNFPQLDLTVHPQVGRALLWPSVLDSDPSSMDNRMYHQALEVEKGLKFAANGWIHLYDYVTPQKHGCN